MKRLFLIILSVLFLASIVYAKGVYYYAGETVTAAGACPGGTYLFTWDGDYQGDTDKGCFDDGNNPKDGTNTGGDLSTDYGESGSVGFRYNAADDRLVWVVGATERTAGIDWNAAAGITVYLRMKIAANETPGNVVIFESYIDADNYVAMYLDDTALARVYAGWKGGGTVDSSGSGANITRDNTWFTVGMTWKSGQGAAVDDLAATLDAGANWSTDQDDLQAIVGDEDDITIGNFAIAYDAAEVICINKIIILSGFKTACPW